MGMELVFRCKETNFGILYAMSHLPTSVRMNHQILYFNLNEELAVSFQIMLTAIVALLLDFLAVMSSSSAGADELFSTSFEDQPSGAFRAISAGPVRLEAEGTAAISTEFARTGKQCLHLMGDEKSSLTLVLPEAIQDVRGLSFHAERWTSKAPFLFSVEVLQAETWREIAKLDRVVEVGKRFRSHVQLAIPGDSKTQAIRFRVTAAPKSGVLVDDLSFLSIAPQKPTSIPSDLMPNEPMELSDSKPLFISGTENTHTFRIPAIITAANGDLIAACDARRTSTADLKLQRSIDIVYRRSSDNGKNWTSMEILDQLDDGGCSDPSLLLDSATGDIFCFYNYMVRDITNNEFRFVVQKSSDHGKTWGKPIDFTDQVAGPDLKNSFKFITSGRGIRTRDGLLLHNFVRVGQGVTLFASADHGLTWKAFCEVSPGDESKVVQLHDDSLMLNSRVEPGKRYVHRSADGGRTWESAADWNLPDPQCNACIVQYTSMRNGYSKDRLIFCNAASVNGRKNLAARISYDGGKTWSAGKVIDSGASAYSEITVLQDGSFGVLYEPGHSEIRFVRFTLESLTGGSDQLTEKYVPTGRP